MSGPEAGGVPRVDGPDRAGGGAGDGHARRRGRADTVRFWLTAAVGWAVVGFGVRGMLHNDAATRPADLIRFVAGGLVAHDLVLVPLVLAAGALVARVVPSSCRPFVQAALIVSGCLIIFAYPLVRGYAHAARNPSSLPHDYAANLAIVLACVWGVAAALAAVAAVRARRGRAGGRAGRAV